MLNRYRDEQQDVRLKVRSIALLMLAQGVSVEIVASSIGKSVRTIIMTRRIDNLASEFNIVLHDHLIVCPSRAFSIKTGRLLTSPIRVV
ncbi:MAG: hypothetical protein AB1611_08150 [bacterium]